MGSQLAATSPSRDIWGPATSLGNVINALSNEVLFTVPAGETWYFRGLTIMTSTNATMTFMIDGGTTLYFVTTANVMQQVMLPGEGLGPIPDGADFEVRNNGGAATTLDLIMFYSRIR